MDAQKVLEERCDAAFCSEGIYECRSILIKVAKVSCTPLG